MNAIEQLAYPRAGLLGNPSDGYFGKTISFTFRDFRARVCLEESQRLRFAANADDSGIEFENLEAFKRRFARRCYGGELRLLHAAAMRFFRHCQDEGLDLPPRNFSLTCDTTIPRQVGLAGSSAIIMAAFKAMAAFYGVAIPLPQLAQLCLEVETVELGIPAGLQDRVAQAFEGLVYMDFGRALMEQQGHGKYERLNASNLTNVFVAWDEMAAEGTEVPHGSLRSRWDAGDAEVRSALHEIASLVDPGRKALEAVELKELGRLINRNFDLRASIVPIHPAHRRMIDAARAAGASAKFAGSGGSIVGLFDSEAVLKRLRQSFAAMSVNLIRPTIV